MGLRDRVAGRQPIGESAAQPSEVEPGIPYRAFDGVVHEYDRAFTDTRLGRWLREAVWARLEDSFGPGDSVLELGCGTGADAVWLAQRGVRVVATDAAPAMVEVARRKTAAAGVDACVGFRLLDVNRLEAWEPGLMFDGLLANFGVLNCVSDWRTVARAAAGWLRPGARAGLVVMSPLCPWEIAWHLLHGDLRTATRRFRSGEEAHIGAEATLPVWYPTPRQLYSRFTPFFRHVETVGIGALLPPTHLNHLVDRWPALFECLAAVERRWSGRFPWTWLNDHYLLVLERVSGVRRAGSLLRSR